MDEKKEKITQMIIGLILFIIVILIDKIIKPSVFIKFILYLIPYLEISFDTFKEAIEEIKENKIFNEHILILIASLGSMFIGLLPNSNEQFIEAIFVILLFQVGELFELIAEGKSEKSIESLMNIRPDYANLVIGRDTKLVSPSDVKIGDLINVKPGEKVPLDGIIVKGNTTVNTIALTGESIPKKLNVDDYIYSGYVNLDELITVKVTKKFNESTASKIIELVKNATNKKSSSEKFITKFSKIYTPIVIILSFLIAIIPSIIYGNIASWIYRALTFLVVSCPCALVISVPLAYFGGIGGASRKGILFKGSNYLDALTKIDTIVFDKTGTLTKGCFEVTSINPKNISRKELLHIIAHAEANSSHPIAVSLMKACKKEINVKDDCKLNKVKELPGLGIETIIEGKKYYVGNDKLMKKIGINYEENEVGTIIHISTNKKYLGSVVISDIIRDDALDVVKFLNEKNINTVMLTGDNDLLASFVSKKVGINKYYSELMPADKVKIIEELYKDNNKNIVFIGDGINDAPVLARSDVGVSMGGIGSDAAIEASDIVLMDDKLSSIIDAIKISNQTNIIVKENIYLSIFIKILTLILAAFGIANMWMAIFADVGVTIIAVLNSIRTLKNNI